MKAEILSFDEVLDSIKSGNVKNIYIIDILGRFIRKVSEAWNERHKEIYQDDFGGITADELERALKEFVQELGTMKKTEEEYRETPKCPICGHRGYNIREIGSDGFNTYVIMTCRNCGTEIRTDKEKIDRFFSGKIGTRY